MDGPPLNMQSNLAYLSLLLAGMYLKESAQAQLNLLGEGVLIILKGTPAGCLFTCL